MTSAGTGSKVDRLLVLTLGLSAGAHALVLGTQIVTAGWEGLADLGKPAKLVYEPQPPDARSARTKDDDRRAQQLRELPSPSAIPAPSASAISARGGISGFDVSDYAARVTIGYGHGEGGLSAALRGGGAWASAIDLSDLTTASQGDPVLHSYFAAMREQIQRTANTRGWVAPDQNAGGVVCIGFVLDRSGAIESAGVVAERSSGPPALREIALRIVKTSSPFLPLPPSFTKSSSTLTLLVPIEFSELP